jgi:hypothetical protein
MATERKTGLGSLPAGLMRPTTPPEPTIPPEAAEAAEAGPDDEGRGDQRAADAVAAAVASAPRSRRKRPVVSTKTTGRKLHLPDDVHDRLWLLARQRRTTVSTVAAEILDRNLPRFKVEREG